MVSYCKYMQCIEEKEFIINPLGSSYKNKRTLENSSTIKTATLLQCQAAKNAQWEKQQA